MEQLHRLTVTLTCGHCSEEVLLQQQRLTQDCLHQLVLFASIYLVNVVLSVYTTTKQCTPGEMLKEWDENWSL